VAEQAAASLVRSLETAPVWPLRCGSSQRSRPRCRPKNRSVSVRPCAWPTSSSCWRAKLRC
jgi:hypothetical protein